MAEDTIGCRAEGDRRAGFSLPDETSTKSRSKDCAKAYWKQLRDGFSIEESTAKHLAEKFGTEAERVLKLCDERKEMERAARRPEPAAIRAEAVYGIREEMAVTIEDLLARRTGIQFFDWRTSDTGRARCCGIARGRAGTEQKGTSGSASEIVHRQD